MNIAIIKYNAGNIHSVRLAIQRLGFQPQLTDNLESIRTADKVIFPGVGEASSAIQHIQQNGIANLLPQLQQPVLGICLGLQLMCRYSEENHTEGLNIFHSIVRKFPPLDKVPQMGWNTISDLQGALFKGVKPESYVYFAHSYYAEIGIQTIARTDYILPFSAALQWRNFYAVQFHPEKSGVVGDKILKNFLEL